MRLPSRSKSKSEVSGQSGHCSARLLAALRATTGTHAAQQMACHRQPSLLDHLVGAHEERFRDYEAQRRRRLEVDNQLELFRRL